MAVERRDAREGEPLEALADPRVAELGRYVIEGGG
jgi:hypothetical protein